MAAILTLTLNPAIDISSETQVVRPTRKIRTSRTRYDPGGGGINVARVVTALGGDAETLFLAGGELGALFDSLLEKEGIRRHMVPIANRTRISFMVRELGTGLEYRFVPEGPVVHARELEHCLDLIASDRSDYVVASGSLPAGAPPDIYARMARSVAARGGRFVLDTSGPALGTTLEQSRVYLVKPSSGEFEHLIGRKLDENEVMQAASEIVARGSAELVAVTMGADGAILASKEGVLRLPAIHVRVRSAVGAGDSFLSAMIWALSQGRPPVEAFRLGIAAGAAAVMRPGTELCRREDVFRLYQAGNATAPETQQLHGSIPA